MNDDIIFEFYRFLPLKDILICSLVSKQFYRVTKNEVLWKGNINEVIKFDGSYLESYKFNYGLERVKVGLKYDKSITELYKADILDLGWSLRRKIETIPSQIGNLHNLKSLYIYGHKLTHIATQIGLLHNLQKLSLANNNLRSVPSELGNLKQLQMLNISFNLLTSIPTELGQLDSLISVFLYSNLLTTLPPQLGQCNLRLIEFTNNPKKIEIQNA
jgi:hypothetical protein